MKIKKRTKRIVLTIMGFLIFQTSFCQENYLPGYIIRSSSDTLHGFIDYRNRERNPGKISFKESLSADKAVYTPVDIKEFGVLDEKYVSAVVETEISPDIENGLDAFSDLKFKTDTAFLQTMIKGPKSLYYYNNKFGKVQFYIKTDSAYELLIHKMYYEEQRGRTALAENKKYLGQLLYYLQDCPEIQSKLNNMEYKKKDIENLFLFYYNHTTQGIKFQKKTEMVLNQFGLLAGVSMTTLKFSSGFLYLDYLTNAKYTHSVNFTGGVYLDLILPRNKRKWSLNNELIFSTFKINGKYDGYAYDNTMIYTTIGFSSLKLNNILRYKYPIGKMFVYFNAGMSNGFVVSEKNNLQNVHQLTDHARITESPAINNSSKYEIGYIVGLGAKFKRYSIDFRYEKGGMQHNREINSTTTRYYFLLGYKF